MPIDCTTRDSVKLGDLASEKVSGFKGIVTSLSYEMDGTVFVGLTPKGLESDGKLPDAAEFDIERITVEESGEVTTHDVADTVKAISLGAVYTDRVTGLKGTAIRVVAFLGGCVRVGLQGKVCKDGKIPDTLFVASERIELEDIKPAVVAESKKKDTGGPGSNERRIVGRMSGH
jgi:hypothetical protein